LLPQFFCLFFSAHNQSIGALARRLSLKNDAGSRMAGPALFRISNPGSLGHSWAKISCQTHRYSFEFLRKKLLFGSKRQRRAVAGEQREGFRRQSPETEYFSWFL
jgi:hypothetical protein